MMYKPDDENLEQSVEEAGVLEEKDISEPETPTDLPPEEADDSPVQES